MCVLTTLKTFRQGQGNQEKISQKSLFGIKHYTTFCLTKHCRDLIPGELQW